MGVRKEYVESMEYFYETCEREQMKYDFPETKRPFPVPEPMWPSREEKQDSFRTFNTVLASDFRISNSHDTHEIKIIKELKEHHDNKLGLVQLYRYDLNFNLEIAHKLRQHIDGYHVQMLVYGEKIKTDRLIIFYEDLFINEQTYIPIIETKEVQVIVYSTIENEMHEKMTHLFNAKPVYYPLTSEVRERLEKLQLENITISTKNWMDDE